MARLMNPAHDVPSNVVVPVYPDDLLGRRDGDTYRYCANGCVYDAAHGASSYRIDDNTGRTPRHYAVAHPIDSLEAFSDALWAHHAMLRT